MTEMAIQEHAKRAPEKSLTITEHRSSARSQ